MSQLEVDKIIPQSGTTLTIGDSGDTVNFADGTSIGIDTNTLYIDSTNNRVGILTSSPAKALQIVKSDDYALRVGASDYYWDLGSISGSSPKLNAVGTSTSAIFEINGSEKMRIDSSGNVGIGTNSPDGITNAKFLQIHSSGSNWSQLILSNDTSGSSTGNGFNLNFNGTDALINNRENGYVSIRTNGTDRMRIDSSGNLMVDKTSLTSASVGIEARVGGFLLATRSGGNPLMVNRTTSDGDIIQLRKDNSTVGNIGTLSSKLHIASTGNSGIRFRDDLNGIIPCNADGSNSDADQDLGHTGVRYRRLYLSEGVFLGGTGSANKFDDYEEGEWTPSFSEGTGTTTAAATHTYTKIGRVVVLNGYIYNSSGATAGNDVQINGLPFTAGSSRGEWKGSTTFHQVTFDTSAIITPIINGGQNYIRYTESRSGSSQDKLTYGDAGTGHFQFSITYITDA